MDNKEVDCGLISVLRFQPSNFLLGFDRSRVVDT